MRQVLALVAMAALGAPPAVKEIRVPVSVEKGAKLEARSLKASIVSSGDARVVRMRGPEDDLLLLLAMDVTGDLNMVDLARQALVDRIATLKPKTQVAVMRAQDDLQVLLDPTADREQARVVISTIPVNGKSALLSTVETAVNLAEAIAAKSTVRIAVLYITDSSVQNYREDFSNPVINSSDSRDLSRRFPEGLIREKVSKLAEVVSRFQTPVSIVHIDYRSDRLNEAYQTGLLDVAAATGGTAVICRNQTEIPGVIQSTIDAIESQYLISVQLPAKAPRNIALQLDAGEQRLRYRDRFVLH